ncbi:hypothetical protein ACQKMD_19040 [Viridibacillus sp. NPDC096237]|uniref:hypothetical protein n=1 Tax=Viridibacillus sp. NPDC096237 TaxID=3390721 RepID=UPI003D084EB6
MNKLYYEDEAKLEEAVAKTLDLLFGDAEAYCNGVHLGFKKEVLEIELKDTSIYEKIGIQSRVAACGWLLKKNSDA